VKSTPKSGSIGFAKNSFSFAKKADGFNKTKSEMHMQFNINAQQTISRCSAADNVTLVAFAASRCGRLAAVPSGAHCCQSISPARQAHSSKTITAACHSQ